MASILDFLLIAAASTLFVAIIYHWVVAGCWRRHHGGPQQQPTMTSGQGETPDSAENWMVELIPTHKHQKGMGLAGEDGKCAVCLCEFEDGEELRTLPQCMHTYHVYCIDMWLYSHSSCPICRANATPSSYIYRRFSGSDIA